MEENHCQLYIWQGDKGLMTRIYRGLKKLNYRKIDDPIFIGQMNWTEIFQRKKSKWPKDT
jgi:hypothetical protein